MTPNLRSVDVQIAEWDELIKVSTKLELRNWIRETLTTDCAHIATVLIAGLERERKDEVKWQKAKYDVKSVEAVIHNRALDTAIALIRQTLTDVTSEEK